MANKRHSGKLSYLAVEENKISVAFEDNPLDLLKFELKVDEPNFPSCLAMLSLLKEAYFSGKNITIDYDSIDLPGHITGVELGKYGLTGEQLPLTGGQPR